MIENSKIQGKLIIFCPSMVAGGLERVLSVLSTPFADHYSNIEYIIWHDKPVFYEIDKRVRIVSVEKECGSSSFLKRIFWFNKYVVRSEPDLLISFSTPFNMIALTALAGTGVKVLVAERVDPLAFRWGRFKRVVRNFLYKKTDGILVQTLSSKMHLPDYLQSKAIIVPNPVVMPDGYHGIALRTPCHPVIVSAGRLSKQKRFDVLISSFSIFKKDHPHYKLVIYGEGKERHSLQRLISTLGLDDSVKLPGLSNKLWDEMISSTAFVMTSEYEGMSNVLIEAMCLGIPCISTKVSGAVDYIENEENGLLVNINDEQELCNAMCKVADDKDFAKRLGGNASKIYDHLNVDVVAGQWIHLINKYAGL